MNIDNQPNPQTVSLQILSKDRVKLVHEIAGIIASLNVPITHHSARVFTDNKKKKMSMFDVSVCVDDEEHLQALLGKLRKIKGVVSVSSVECFFQKPKNF